MNTLVLSDGTNITFPVMITAGAGWHLRPDEARTELEIRRGLNKSFGRGFDGQEVASAWFLNHMQSQFDDADWKPVVSHDYSVLNGAPRGTGLTLAVLDKIYGWNSISFKVTEPGRYGSNGNWIIHTEWEGVQLQKWYRDKKVDHNHPYLRTILGESNLTFTSRHNDMYKLAEQFAKDPTAYIENVLAVKLPWTTASVPPLDWGPARASSAFLDDAETYWVTSDDEHVFYRNGEQAANIVVEADEQIGMLEQAFRHLGMDIRIRTGVKWGLGSDDPRYMKETLQGFSITIPQNSEDDNNRRGHQIDITLEGIEIECGYIKDDKQWEHWKGRQAADWLNQFEQETLTSSPTYEDYEYKPDQSEVR